MIYINPDYKGIFHEFKLVETKEMMEFFQSGEMVSASSISRLWKKKLGEEMLYAKKYESTYSLRYFCRRSRGMREFLAYRFFQSCGIPGPVVVYFEEKRLLGNLLWSFLVTQNIDSTVDLFSFFEKRPANGHLRQKIMESLAKIAWQIHSCGFYHKDFKLRNILLSTIEESNPKLYLIDCPKSVQKKSFSPRLALWDIVTLYKHTSFLCTPAEWQIFMDVYAKERGCDVNRLSQDMLRRYTKKFGRQ
ncbi:MAG: hypothetical protein HUU50_09995 [Candidatus Brocadiae bacterium]|nr:hypothetical protein [Candidatus Brocadiia bacterium]